jgi:tetratricopeptide (TPR) repeat protein
VEKKTASRANAKEAAAAYRHLGAIAGLADPKRALEAYEEAVALNPDDIASPYWAGAILVDCGDLTNAQKRLERVSKLAETAISRFINVGHSPASAISSKNAATFLARSNPSSMDSRLSTFWRNPTPAMPDGNMLSESATGGSAAFESRRGTLALH